MSAKIKIIFYNFYNIGDTYLAQPFVKNIINNNGDHFEYYILSKFNFFIYTSIFPDIKIIQNDILKDLNINISYNELAFLNYYHSKQYGILFINTWIHTLCYYLTGLTGFDCCDTVSHMKAHKVLLNIIYHSENIHIKYNDDPLLVAPTFPPNLDINNFLNFKKNNSDKKIVFINNYYPMSVQIISIQNNTADRIRLIDFFIKKNYIVLLPEYEHDLQVYKEQNNVTDLYFAPLIFNMVIDTSSYDVYFYAKVAHNCDLALYFDTGRNFIYLNQEFIDEYKNNINRNTKIHFGIDDKFFKPLSNQIYFPVGYVKFIQANGGDEIVEKLENSNYV
jgi:hypothetical protein